MHSATLDEKIEFAITVLVVMRKRLDLEAQIMNAYRDLVGRTPGTDPMSSSLKLSNDLSDVGRTVLTEAQREALLELLVATLHDWHQVTTEFKHWISKEMRNRAALRGEDPVFAELALDKVTSGARGAAEIQAERQAKVDAETKKREKLREARALDKVRVSKQQEAIFLSSSATG